MVNTTTLALQGDLGMPGYGSGLFPNARVRVAGAAIAQDAFSGTPAWSPPI